MRITSSAFSDGSNIPVRYTCDGEDINPPLEIHDVPANAKALVLIVDDPDAPGGTWVHWTVWGIDPTTKTIAENSVPSGALQGITSSGDQGYGGPCPPDREHRYFFKLYALDMNIHLPSATTADQLEAAIVGHSIAQAKLMGRYTRN